MSGTLFSALVLAISAPVQAAPEWSVRGRGAGALVADAYRALLADPAPPKVARRLLRGPGARLLPGLLARLERAVLEQAEPFVPLMALGHLRLESGDGSGALGAFETAHGLRPEAPSPLLWRARCLFRLGRIGEALNVYQELGARPGPEPSRRAWLQELAEKAFEAGRLDVEVAALRDRAALDPEDWVAIARLADALERTGRPAEAAQVLATWMGRHRRGWPPSAQALGRWLELEVRAGGFDSATARLETAFSERSFAPRARAAIYRRLGEAALDVGQATAAVRWLEGRLARCPAGACGPEAAAIASLRRSLGEPADRAPGPASQVPRKGRSGADPLLALAELEARLPLADGEEWKPVFDRALRVARANPALYERLADLASRLGDSERVTACFEQLLEAEPHNRRAIVGLGEAHFQSGRRELARRVWRRLLGAVRPRTVALAELAEILADHGFLDEAESHARAALERAPRSGEHHQILARILEARREFGAAASAWRAVLVLSPGAGGQSLRREARTRLIELFGREGRERLQAETVTLRSRLRQQPHDREAALFLAEIELLLGRPSQAVEALTTAAGAKGADEELLGRLIALLRQSKQHGAALEWLSRLAEAHPARAPGAFLTMAEIRADAYQDEAAVAAANRAMEAAPRAADVLLRAGQLLERLGKTAAAAQAYHAAKDAGDDAPGIAEQAATALVSLRRREMAQPEPQSTVPPISTAEVWTLRQSAEQDPAAQEKLRKTARRQARVLLRQLTSQGSPAPTEAMLLAGLLGLEDTVFALRAWLSRSASGELSSAESEDPDAVAQRAAIALGRIGDSRAAADLVRVATGRAARPVRLAATWALGRVRAARHEDTLAALTEDQDPSIAALALLGLGRLGGPAASARLRQVALDPAAPEQVRRAALLGLALEPGPAPLASTLAPLFESAPALVHAAALAVGAHADSEELETLLGLLLGGSPVEQKGATRALAYHLGGGTLPDESRAVLGERVETAALLSALEAPPAHPEALADPSAAGVLGALFSREPQAVAVALEQTLSRHGPGIRRALELLARVETAPCARPEAPRERGVCSVLMSAFTALLGDPELSTRASALLAAARLAVPVPGARALAEVLAALEAGPPPAEGALYLAAGGNTAHLWSTDHPPPPGLEPHARALLRNPHPPARRLGLALLGRAGRLRAAEVGAAFSDRDPRVRAEAATWAREPAHLARAAHDLNPAVRIAAAKALGARSLGPWALPLLAGLARDEVAAVRRAAGLRAADGRPKPGSAPPP